MVAGWQRLRRYAGSMFMLAALACLLLAMLQPRWDFSRTVYRYAFVFDITQSMNTRDYQLDGDAIDRLTISKRAVQNTLKHMPCGSMVALGLYTANNSYLLFNPLEVCEHYTIISNVLKHIDWRMAWANDSKIQYGLFAALELLNEQDDPPQLVFMSDGDQSPKSERLPAFMSEPGEPGGFIVGVGNEVPTPVPHLDEDNNISGYWTREEAVNNPTVDALSSQLYLSRLDEANLQRLAEITGMQYLRLEAPDVLAATLSGSAGAQFGQQKIVNSDVRWVFAGLALVFLFLSGIKLNRT